jgi:prolyl-tRNA editing enzyme YbaK/EbsC (Cys-tRNA(Pro) deacylase)
MPVVVITDSSSRLLPDELKQFDIRQVPLHILVDGTDLRDGVDDVLAIACGPSRIAVDKLQTATGLSALKLAKPPYVLARTGYPVGAMPPVAHEQEIAVIMDERVAALDVAIAGGGRIDALLRITPVEILRVTAGRIASITE